MSYQQPVTSVQEKDHHCCTKSLSWTAVITGALVGIGLSFLLNLFSVAIGLTAYTTSSEGQTALAVGGFFGMAIGIMAVMFTSGWVSGYLGRRHYCQCVPGATCKCNCNVGVLYGFTTWVLALILTVLLASSVSQFTSMQYESIKNTNGVAVKVSSQPGTPVIAAQPAAPAKATGARAASEEAASKELGKDLFLVFLLFFVGAITSSFGGYVGMLHCAKRCEDKNKNTP